MESKYVKSNLIVKLLMTAVDYISVICGIVCLYYHTTSFYNSSLLEPRL